MYSTGLKYELGWPLNLFTEDKQPLTEWDTFLNNRLFCSGIIHKKDSFIPQSIFIIRVFLAVYLLFKYQITI